MASIFPGLHTGIFSELVMPAAIIKSVGNVVTKKSSGSKAAALSNYKLEVEWIPIHILPPIH